MEDPEPRPLDGPGERTTRVELSLSVEEQWTLHHVLLDRIDADDSATDTARDGPPPREAVRAFERLDRGETTFTVAELDAIRSILATYHHSSTWWELERPRIERLLHRVSEPIEARRSGESRG